ncbi:ShlB/FhaC/HecB family hemolysin secretion/activation protein [Massilia phyllosphaerae]|uniref:ShlB/FhaC/HecB family hemolysin secretion/activation protein n=1 Tax=Massilia phyllosphaerae TaxID=3106034 RepID=UPI002B1CCFAA|nr:ShlB/FhaC/HecB family hemolysin secretion/activation protein [Massilia sp. SGZ-792]
MKPLAGALALVSLSAHAYQSGVPNSGTILQQVQPVPLPATQQGKPALQVQPQQAAPAPATAPFAVKEIHIDGNTQFSTPELHALVADLEGRILTLAQLEQAAARITDYYQRNGFPLSRAVIPAQTIADGAVRIQVLEACYGAVRLQNGSRVSDALLNATASPLQSGQPIADRELDRTLLLLSDIPGIGVSAVLKPGADVGTSDLDVVTSPTAAAAANVALDNYGNRYIGRTRLSGSAKVFNPLHHGDILDLSAITTGGDMNYARLGYDVLVGGAGTRVGAAYSYVRYKLGGEFGTLGAQGTAGVASAWIRQPIVRAKEANVYAQLEYDDKRLRDRIDITDTRTYRRLGDWIATLNGDLRDGLLGGGQTTWSVGWTRGHNRFDDAAAESADALAARTRGNFSKWNANLSRTQSLGAHDLLVFSAGAQWANANLDSAEKITVGGPFTVRAYDVGAVSGDTGYVASAELRHDLGAFAAGRWQLSAFVDGARVKINRHPWMPSENTVTLSGAGFGLAWAGPDGWHADVAVSTQIGGVPDALPSPSSVRGWAIVSKGF